MLPILTPVESALLDRESADRGVSVEELMENAGRAVARAVSRVAGGSYGRRALVVCGKGNNGGDGFVAARYLKRWGMGVSVVTVDPSKPSGAAGVNFARFAARGGRIHDLSSQRMERELGRSDVVVDAVFGTGFRGSPEGEVAEAIRRINESQLPVVAVDIPSGVDAETGDVKGEAIRATLTVTFGALKPGLVLYPGADRAGEVEVTDIGFPPGLLRSDLFLVEGSDVAAAIEPRQPEAHKRSVGVVLVIAGSRHMTGAAALATQAAYRAGAGLVTLAAPRSVLSVVQPTIREATYLELPETHEGTVARDAWSAVRERLEDIDAAAIGPGLTTHPSTAELVRRFVAESPVPFVVDADGLNAFVGKTHLLSERASGAVITPHAGEFGRLTNLSAREVVEDRIGHARKAAAEFRCVVLLKGSRTVVAEPRGQAFVNATGGSYLATGGTGDVLTGAIAALLSKGLSPADAAFAAAHVHGLAGKLAAERLGEGTTASDVAEHLAEAFRSVRSDWAA